MCDMPELAAKGAILKKLDLASKDAPMRNRILTDLQDMSPIPLPMIAERHGATSKEVTHLRDHWFGGGSSRWWPTLPAGRVEQVIRTGVTVAFQEAVDRNLPIDSYWICHPGHKSGTSVDPLITQAAPDEGHGVEVDVSWSSVQVTLLIHTPDPPRRDGYGSPDNLDPIKVIKALDTGEIVIRDLSKPQPQV